MRLTLLFALTALWPLVLIAQDTPSHIEQIIDTNSLDLPGKSPFHLKLEFQLYSLEGKPADSGTIEQWWAAPGATRIQITAKSLNTADAVPFDNDLKIDPRERYLLNRLLQAELQPISAVAARTFGNVPGGLKEVTRTFGKVTLDCFSIPVSDPTGSGRPPETFCTEPKGNDLRIQFEGSSSNTVRNGLGTFKGTTVALQLAISFEQRLAITGKVTTLQAFDPATSNIVLSLPPAASAPAAGGVKAGVTVGKVLSKAAPVYPPLAKANHTSGSVLLHAVISRQGAVTDIVPIASPDTSLTAAAVDAVKQWKYQPFLLNGQPTDFETTIQINFNMR